MATLQEVEALFEGVSDHRKRAAVLALAETGRKDKAARAAGVSYSTIHHWIQSDESFSQAFDNASKVAVELLENEAVRRGKDGTLKPVYQGGKLVGHTKEYSDALLMFLLKGLKPERYVERKEIYNVDVASRLREGRQRSIKATLERVQARKQLSEATYRVVKDDEVKAFVDASAKPSTMDGTVGAQAAESPATPLPKKKGINPMFRRRMA